MKISKDFLERFKYKKGQPRHTKAALVDEIIKVVGESRAYNYGYWLGKITNFEKKGGAVGTILAWLKEISQYPNNFNKGAILTNKLSKYGRPTNNE